LVSLNFLRIESSGHIHNFLGDVLDGSKWPTGSGKTAEIGCEGRSGT